MLKALGMEWYKNCRYGKHNITERARDPPGAGKLFIIFRVGQPESDYNTEKCRLWCGNATGLSVAEKVRCGEVPVTER